MLKNLFNSNLEVLLSCTEKSSVITTGFDSYSELLLFFQSLNSKLKYLTRNFN